MPANQTMSPDELLARRAIDRIGIDAFALRFQLRRRTVERIYSGNRPCPPRLLETLRQLDSRP